MERCTSLRRCALWPSRRSVSALSPAYLVPRRRRPLPSRPQHLARPTLSETWLTLHLTRLRRMLYAFLLGLVAREPANDSIRADAVERCLAFRERLCGDRRGSCSSLGKVMLHYGPRVRCGQVCFYPGQLCQRLRASERDGCVSVTRSTTWSMSHLTCQLIRCRPRGEYHNKSTF